MFHYFDGVTEETWLDNSTPLVKTQISMIPTLRRNLVTSAITTTPSDTQLNQVKAGIKPWSKTLLSNSKTEF